jgi:hypothetical protein
MFSAEGRDEGGDGVAEVGAAEHGVEVAVHVAGDGGDVSLVFGHQDDEHGADDEQRAEVRMRRLQGREAHPCGLAEAGHCLRVELSERRRQGVAHEDADEDR